MRHDGIQRLRTGAENRAFPGPVPEPAEGGPGRVLLAEHARLIEPLARLATKVRRPPLKGTIATKQ